MPPTGTGQLAGILGALGAVGVLAAAAGVVLAWEGLLPVAAFLLAGEYVASLYARGGAVERWSPLVAVALLALVELGVWSMQVRVRVSQERAVVLARAASLFVLLAASGGAAALVLATTGLPRASGIEWAAMGTAAAVAVLGVIARLSREHR